MAFLKATIAFVACLAMAQAQFPVQTSPSCDNQRTIRGVNTMSDSNYCQLFYQCDLANNPKARSCNVGELFDEISQNCKAPQDTVCKSWSCPNSLINFPDLCCDKYWECNNNVFTQKDCGVGQSFDRVRGQCVNGVACQSNELCPSILVNNPQQMACPLQAAANGNPCSFKFVNIDGDLACAAGTWWNQTACTCSYLPAGQTCSSGDVLRRRTQNKQIDSLCRASFRVDFSGSQLVALSDKDNTPYQVSDGFLLNAVNLFNNEATLSVTPGSSPYIYSYYYVSNELRSPVAMTVVFRPSGVQQGQTFDLISNSFDQNTPVCSTGAVSVKVTYASINNFNFVVSATGSSGTVDTFNFNVNASPNNFLRFVFTFDNVVRAQVFDMGPGGNNAPLSVGSRVSTVGLGRALAFNTCGLTIGGGLDGVIREFNVYEGCGNQFSNLLQNP